MIYESQNDYLMHYRTKGSKNGIRRYQNEDGSLTAEGRDHYGVGDPRRAGGLHDKQGNKVSVGANIRAGYKNTKGVAKAAFKMLFKKKNGKAAAPAAGGIGNQNKKTETEQKTEAQKPKKMSRQEKIRKTTKIMSTAVKIGAAAALVGIGLKNKDKLKTAASFIKDAAGDFGNHVIKGSYHDAKARDIERRARSSTSIGEQARAAAKASQHRMKRRKAWGL